MPTWRDVAAAVASCGMSYWLRLWYELLGTAVVCVDVMVSDTWLSLDLMLVHVSSVCRQAAFIEFKSGDGAPKHTLMDENRARLKTAKKKAKVSHGRPDDPSDDFRHSVQLVSTCTLPLMPEDDIACDNL